MSNLPNTEPGTESNLRLQHDATPFSPGKLSNPYPVLVDGILGVASIGSHGAYSDRLLITLEDEHPDFGKEFGPKNFRIDEPASVNWGHDGKSFTIEKIVETTPR